MPPHVKSTVERLDRPSAYYSNKVCYNIIRDNSSRAYPVLQNKRRQRNEDGDEPVAEPAIDPLAEATTLYVGNL